MSLLRNPLKRTLTTLFYKTSSKSKVDKNAFIIYKVVDSFLLKNEEFYTIQCINTKATLELNIEELVFDLDILHGLHPIQSCFIGIEYAKNKKNEARELQYSNGYSSCRYGNNNLLYRNRAGQLGFACNNIDDVFVMDPRDIALSRELIEEFDAAQAFCIGVLAGLKLINPVAKHHIISNPRQHLSLVKG